MTSVLEPSASATFVCDRSLGFANLYNVFGAAQILSKSYTAEHDFEFTSQEWTIYQFGSNHTSQPIGSLPLSIFIGIHVPGDANFYI